MMSVAEPGTEIAGTEEHVCWPGKVTKAMQCKVYFCILNPLCKVSLRKPKEKVWDFFFLHLLSFIFLMRLAIAIKLNVFRL